MELKVDFQRKNGTIRALNGMNFGPYLSGQKNFDNSADYRSLRIPLARLHDVPLTNPGLRLVDIQHIFGNWHADENDPRNYYFKATDDYIRNTLACGTGIIYRLGTSIEHSVQNYYAFPPEDFDKWVRICINIVRHYNEGWANGFSWNIQYWEVWNEPNAKPHMWSGSDLLYMQLYVKFAKALKAHNPALKVGGPSLSSPVQPSSWESPRRYEREFLRYCKKENAPIDFFGWHCYPVDLEYIINEPFRIKKVLEEEGYPEAELQLNEWHFTKSWEHSREMKDGMHGINGIDSACAVANILTAWQDSPITMGNYYTAGCSGGWGLWDAYRQKYKTFYAFSAFAEVLDHPDRVTASSPCREVSILAGTGKDQGVVLASAFETAENTFELDFASAPLSGVKVLVLDEEKNLEEVPAVWESGKLRLSKSGSSALWLIIGQCKN